MGAGLVIVKTGDASEVVRHRHGDYDRMFVRMLGGEPEVVNAHRGEALPPPAAVSAVLVTGSPHSVTEAQPWAVQLAGWIRDLVERRVPLLGVCYGHQLLAHALGGVVTQNPRGYEIGTVPVELTEAGRTDPLLGSLGEPLRFQAVHADAVVRLPPRAKRLATNEAAHVQAFSVGGTAWGVQFHPEFTVEIMEAYLVAKKREIAAMACAQGVDPKALLENIEKGLGPTPCGLEVLERFQKMAGLTG